MTMQDSTQVTFGFQDFGFAKIGNIRNVRYLHPSNTINNGLVCTIDLELPNEPVQEGLTYVCHADDKVSSGMYVWEKCSSVDPSKISPWMPPPEPSLEMKIEMNRRTRDSLLTEIDRIATNPIRWAELNDSERNQVIEYRNGLKNVPQQADFPNNIVWPTVPECISRHCSVIASDELGLPITVRPPVV